MSEEVICPWCLTEITWDPEFGPEKHCPHCGNELSSYRTVELGGDAGEETDEEEQGNPGQWQEDEEEDYESDGHDLGHKRWLAEGEGYRNADRSSLALENTLQRITDEQDEVPECPACREFMLEAGTQSIGGEQYKPTVSPVLGQPALPAPLELVWYVCPSCFHTSSTLSPSNRQLLLKRLAKPE
ncbi:hypothetical protein [Paenibacillus harenae]|uniref:hypothetical protein n=1 Tax=Paenibacillus harenae TaxID=306543 RepID=UPI002791ADD4|nr:hypothetical protein [Paenibacillus harenae]MDQ0061147.1 putative RNA-binding Zn-ribbon protein involved in translation (DUF1610 family) [Paenibacillus harenae]